MDGNEIANGFNQNNDKATWGARAISRGRKSGVVDMVHFTARNGMVSLEYDVEQGLFSVKFNKFQGAWGDYVKAIARGLFTVLNTLKSAGLPFEAPFTLADMVIECRTTEDSTVYVAWKPRTVQAVDPVMPELRQVGVSPALAEPYGGGPEVQGDVYAAMAQRVQSAQDSIAKLNAIARAANTCPVCLADWDGTRCLDCAYTGEKGLPDVL